MNRLPGEIADIAVHGSIALIDVQVGARRFTATLIGASEEAAGWKPGMAVTLLFKETEVSLAKNLSGLISMRNRIPCTVAAIERGTLLTRVTLDFEGRALESVITTRSSHALGLAIGDAVEGLVKANEMTLLPEAGA
ncbi:TOBE domain-containing protein [Noviherbaspirillum sp.]|uniref:TOBE domain-containing protein n=1 Tax=Noviherbaspirillum sp. TaxID=1926288 RepID=UPI002D3B5EF8|nr:TOBE domain-containing protein [Noviherbaspirillum sp.]HZW21939.1 TOBE domain-containing protein [Noviherbaspirillum sp.]